MFWLRAPELDFTRTILRKGCVTATQHRSIRVGAMHDRVVGKPLCKTCILMRMARPDVARKKWLNCPDQEIASADQQGSSGIASGSTMMAAIGTINRKTCLG